MEDIRKGVCPLCQHNEIVETTPKMFGQGPLSATASAPLVAQVETHGRFNPTTTASGALVLFACRRCGYAQLFALAADAIPVGEEHGTRLLKGPEPEGPFR